MYVYQDIYDASSGLKAKIHQSVKETTSEKKNQTRVDENLPPPKALNFGIK